MSVLLSDKKVQKHFVPVIRPDLESYWVTFFVVNKYPDRLCFIGDENIIYFDNLPSDLPDTILSKTVVIMNQTVPGMLDGNTNSWFLFNPYSLCTVKGMENIGWPFVRNVNFDHNLNTWEYSYANVYVLVVTEKERDEWEWMSMRMQHNDA